MSFTYEYEVQECRTVEGENVWTVLEYRITPTLLVIDEAMTVVLVRECLGGDFHWITEDYAHAAKISYEVGALRHGRSSASEAIAYFELAGVKLP